RLEPLRCSNWPSLNKRPHGEVSKRTTLQLTTHAAERVLQLEEVGPTEFEGVLVRLERSACWVIHVRRERILNVRAEDMGNVVSPCEIHQTINTLCERCSVANVETTRVQRVPCQEDTGPSVVDGDPMPDHDRESR